MTKEQLEYEKAMARLDSLKEQINEDHKKLLYLYENGFAKRFPEHSFYGQKFICEAVTGEMGIFPESINTYKNMGIAGKFGFDNSMAFDSGPDDPCLVFDDELFVVDSNDCNKQSYNISYAPTKSQIIEFCEKFEDFHQKFSEWLDKNLSQDRQEQKDNQVLIR